MPRRPKRDLEAVEPRVADVDPPVADVVEPSVAQGDPPVADAETPVTDAEQAVADAQPPVVDQDPGLYAVLGLTPSASDPEIQTSYRRQAARLLGSGTNDIAALRQLNAAYEVLGNPVRRAEYDRLRSAQRPAPGPSPLPRPGFAGAALPPGAKHSPKFAPRRRPRAIVQVRTAGLPDVLALIVVVVVSAAAFAFIIPRLSINLSSLNQLSNVLPVGNSSRRPIIEATLSPAPTASATRAPTASPVGTPTLADRFAGSTVSVSAASPPQNTPETIIVKLRRDGQPATNLDVYATVDYRTTQERWPAVGTVKTDTTGTAAITFNVGQATPGYQVRVHVFAEVDNQQLSWSTSFTPR